MQYSDFIYPEDAAAWNALKYIPIFSVIAKKVMDVGCRAVACGAQYGLESKAFA